MKKINGYTVLIYIIVSLVALFTLLPFLLVLAGSFTAQHELVRGIRLWPREFSLDGYRLIFENSNSILTGYRISIIVTVIGTLLSLYLTASLAYVTSIPTLKLRNIISFFIYFTMLFSGGLVPWYILIVRYLGLRDTLWALILPMLINPFFVMLMRTYFRGIPDSLRESGLIDGASEFKILIRIILPVSTPIIATITLFYMLTYWNDWFHALFFIDSRHLVPLQFNLYRIVDNINFLASLTALQESSTGASYSMPPAQLIQMATVILTIGPIIFVYPFLQKHFVKGIIIGAIKG
ncbi:MAG: carbohydrate ABC transporter permease [Defluviitaleaceae bacterium]|nr:carbohydrate ABC transporter permease [Defluviitaleaceae bacterium]